MDFITLNEFAIDTQQGCGVKPVTLLSAVVILPVFAPPQLQVYKQVVNLIPLPQADAP